MLLLLFQLVEDDTIEHKQTRYFQTGLHSLFRKQLVQGLTRKKKFCEIDHPLFEFLNRPY